MVVIEPLARDRALSTWGALGLLMLASAGCGSTLRGRVLDAETGQPIAGAAVYGDWSAPCNVSWACIQAFQRSLVPISGVGHTEEAKTDAQGEFTLDRPSFFDKGTEIIAVYKCGYSVGDQRTDYARGGRKDPAAPVDIRITSAPSAAPLSVPSSLPFPSLRAAVAACESKRSPSSRPGASSEDIGAKSDQPKPSAGPLQRGGMIWYGPPETAPGFMRPGEAMPSPARSTSGDRPDLLNACVRHL